MRETTDSPTDLLTPEAEQLCADALSPDIWPIGMRQSPNGYHNAFQTMPLSGLYIAICKAETIDARQRAIDNWLETLGHTPSQVGKANRRIAERTPGAHEAPPRPRLTTHTLLELLAMQFEPPKWAIEGLVPQGLTLFAGKPKMGKSHLMLQCGMGIAWGGYVFGTMPVDGGTVLYLDMENGDELLQERVINALHEQPCPPAFHYATVAPRIDETLLDAFDTWMDERPDTRVIVIDTFEAVRGASKPTASIYREDYAALRPLADWAKARRVAVVVLHHISKSMADDVFATISGSFGLTGAVDNLMVLSETPNGMVLAVKGRRVKHREIALTFDQVTAQWSYTGDAEDVALSNERRAVIALLRGDDNSLYPREIAEELGKKNVRMLLTRMAESGELVREKGKYSLSPAFKSRTAFTRVTDVTTDPATGVKQPTNPVTPPRYNRPDQPPTDDTGRKPPLVTPQNGRSYTPPPEENGPIVTDVTGVTPSDEYDEPPEEEDYPGGVF